jgi:hypothetical protein
MHIRGYDVEEVKNLERSKKYKSTDLAYAPTGEQKCEQCFIQTSHLQETVQTNTWLEDYDSR